MNLRAVATLTLDGGAKTVTVAGTEVILQKYFVNPGKREMKAVLSPIWGGAASDSGTFDYKLQDANTTVDSDFSDISGATFTQVSGDSDNTGATAEAIHFFTAKQYVRGYSTFAGTGTYYVAATLFAMKRDA